MNKNLAETEALLTELSAKLPDTEAEVMVAPTYVNLTGAIRHLESSAIEVIAQNMHFAESGAYTGEISADMLLNIGVDTVIIGHSERRENHVETNEIIRKKFNSAVSNNLKPILCVGESLDQRQKEETFNHLENQILSVINKEVLSNHPFIIAYEPIWAIGTGETATPEIANEVHIFIQETLDKIDSIQSKKIAIIYGGSVNSNNAYDLFKMSHINGALIGGSSLDVNEFNKIYNIAKEINNE